MALFQPRHPHSTPYGLMLWLEVPTSASKMPIHDRNRANERTSSPRMRSSTLFEHPPPVFTRAASLDFTHSARLNLKATFSVDTTFLLLHHGSTIDLYATDTTCPATFLRPVTRTTCPRTVGKVALDASAGQYTVASLLKGGVGCVAKPGEELVRNDEAKSIANAEMPRLKAPPMLFKPIGGCENLPLSLALCPTRQSCIAFGYRTGVQLHWLDGRGRAERRRWRKRYFLLITPSEILRFVPPSPYRDADQEEARLKLASSADVPATPPAPSSLSSSRNVRAWPQLKALVYISPISPPRNEHFCDHFRAIPLRDGRLTLFVDPKDMTLTLGREGGGHSGSGRLERLIKLNNRGVGTIGESTTTWRMDHGLRVVTSFRQGDGEEIIVFTVPPDIIHALGRDGVSKEKMREEP